MTFSALSRQRQDYDPRTFQIAQDRDGFFIADDEGAPVEAHPERRYTSVASAKDALDEMVADDIERQRQEEDGPTDDQIYNGPGIEGGVRYGR